MQQRYTRAKGYTVSPGDTNAHTFPDETGGVVYLSTPSGNSGTVTIREPGGTGGLVLGPGVGVTIPVVVLGPILKLSALEYKFSNGADVLNYLVIG
ncbi:MAG TPA: hypothetical protein VGE74_28205 [Gemmata sp.]